MKVEPIAMTCKPRSDVRKFGNLLLHRQEPFVVKGDRDQAKQNCSLVNSKHKVVGGGLTQVSERP